jgi:hypothetical protein
MSRAPARATQADISRAVRAATAAGLTVSAVEVDPSGKIVILTGRRETGAADANNVVADRLKRMGARLG